MNKEKDLRMVFWVPYNISEIQKGIQAGHCAEQYANKMINLVDVTKQTVTAKEELLFETWKDYLDNHKTWMVYNGGTTNSREDYFGSPKGELYEGTLNNIPLKLEDLGIYYATFNEPDLNDALSSVCCIVDFTEVDFETPLEELDVESLEYFIRTQRFA